ncbi:hypothetical protein [Embleya sp. NPDC059259]|uniref:hypothetical protein n=1 Tax=unclassified Embleya TaxID=2699296 RepID=UPI00368AFEF3
MIPELSPGRLDWDEADPSRHAFDQASATRVVHSLRPARRIPRRPEVDIVDPAMNAWAGGEARHWADAM